MCSIIILMVVGRDDCFSVQIMRYGQLKFGDFGQKSLNRLYSAYFCHLNHFCHSSRLLSIHINHFCQPHRFCQLLSTQSSPILSQISTTYVITDEVTTFVNRSAHFCRPHIFCLIHEWYSVTDNVVLRTLYTLIVYNVRKTTLSVTC